MIPEKMLEMIILKGILEDYDRYKDYKKFIKDNFDIKSIENRYIELGKEFLDKYKKKPICN